MLKFQNSYKSLPLCLYTDARPAVFPKSKVLLFNTDLAAEFDDTQLLNKELDMLLNDLQFGTQEYIDSPICLSYAGHQFGHFVPLLGDGRAHLLGEWRNKEGNLRDIQLKGSGKSPYSRGGDGLATLSSMIREYVVSEAMCGLRIPTSRSLALISSGETVFRGQEEPGGILIRVAQSHVRVGTLERLAHLNCLKELEQLLDMVITRHYSSFWIDTPEKIEMFLQAWMKKQIDLVVEWLGVGFIHGVMNTDNTTLSGETLDFGPCAFLDEYEHYKVFSAIDSFGRYAYGNQGNSLFWNFQRLLDSLRILIPKNDLDWNDFTEKCLSDFKSYFNQCFFKKFGSKIGIFDFNTDYSQKQIRDLLFIMEKNKLDFTVTFKSLEWHLRTLLTQEIGNPWEKSPNPPAVSLADLFQISDGLKEWVLLWRHQLDLADAKVVNPEKLKKHIDLMSLANPSLIPRNHLVEKYIKECVEKNELAGLKKWMEALKNPYCMDNIDLAWVTPPEDSQKVKQTHCGT